PSARCVNATTTGFQMTSQLVSRLQRTLSAVNHVKHARIKLFWGVNRLYSAGKSRLKFRGVIVLEEESFGLEPLPGSTSNQHVLYALSDVHPGAATCGVSNGEEDEVSSQTKPILNQDTLSPHFCYNSFFTFPVRFQKKNETAVRQEMVEVANLVDGYYKRLNVRVMLVHLEVFKESNPFSIEGEPGEVLSRFAKWRKDDLLPRSRNDMAQFVIGRTGAYGAVLGMAFVGTVCSVASSAGINVFTDSAQLPYFSTIVAHEMGHNLGMNHDDKSCNCNGGCIMGGGGGSQFSTCSANDFEKLVLRGGGACLKNVPSHSDIVGIAKCGNGLLEEEEQCDCGTPQACKDKCCDAATCRFTQGSVCAAGRCCQDCQIKVAGSPCRASEDVCDLPEFCTGKSAFCPDEFYLMDGLQCQSGAAYCYEGRCQTYDFQCRQIFSASKADDICFKTANARGDKFGNCGQTKPDVYVKCPSPDALCGKVQCTNVDANHPPPGGSISNQIVNGSKCVNADFNLGTDVMDPAYSNPGSPCAPDKTCVDFKCVDASVLLPDLNCDAKTTCNSRGVCNNQGHCHCDVGWGPPDCASSGRGGSIDSGPATIDYSLRNGLLIFFLLVVPVLVLVILLFLYLFRRDSLDPCLKRRRK
uniref:Zgc:174164 n=1 Tax=Neogobius melanostomus TaxID=47308 RepID=A0A8C6WWM8_9GOBI